MTPKVYLKALVLLGRDAKVHEQIASQIIIPPRTPMHWSVRALSFTADFDQRLCAEIYPKVVDCLAIEPVPVVCRRCFFCLVSKAVLSKIGHTIVDFQSL